MAQTKTHLIRTGHRTFIFYVARQIHPFVDDVFIEQDMDMAVLKCYANFRMNWRRPCRWWKLGMSVEFLSVVTFSDRKSLHFCIFFLVEHIYCLSIFVLEFLFVVSFCGDVPTLLYLFLWWLSYLVIQDLPLWKSHQKSHWNPFKFIEIHGSSTTKAFFSGQIGVSWWILGRHDGRHGSLGSHGSCVGRSHGMPGGHGGHGLVWDMQS